MVSVASPGVHTQDLVACLITLSAEAAVDVEKVEPSGDLPSDVGFVLEPDDTIRVHFAADVNDDSSAWVFCHRRLPPRHAISVAAKKDFDDGCELILRPVKFPGARIAPAA